MNPYPHDGASLAADSEYKHTCVSMGRTGKGLVGGTGRIEGLMASETGLFVLMHVPDSHTFRGERSQLQITSHCSPWF